jgi:hypothetical protein
LLNAFVISAVVLSEVFIRLLGSEEFRLLPAAVAIITFAGVRPMLNPELASSPKAPDIFYSPDTRIPDSMRTTPKNS